MPVLTPRLPPRRFRTHLTQTSTTRDDGASDGGDNANTESGSEDPEENAFRRSWRRILAMIFNGPPHDWIDSDDHPNPRSNEPDPPRFLHDTWTNLHPWTPIDVAQRNMVQSIGLDFDRNFFHPEDSCPVGRLVTQTIGGLCTGVPALGTHIPVKGLPVPWMDRGGIAVRSFTRQEQSLHRWKPLTADRLALLTQRAQVKHPKRLPTTHLCIAIDELNYKHLRASIETEGDATIDALEEVLPMQLPTPLLSPRTYTPTAESLNDALNNIFTSAVRVEHEEETDDFGFTLRTSTARLHHSLRFDAYNVVPIGILVPHSLQVAERRSQLAGINASHANGVRAQTN
jgi:hypothetical protein